MMIFQNREIVVFLAQITLGGNLEWIVLSWVFKIMDYGSNVHRHDFQWGEFHYFMFLDVRDEIMDSLQLL